MQYFAMRTTKNFKVNKTVLGARPKFSKTTEGEQYMSCSINRMPNVKEKQDNLGTPLGNKDTEKKSCQHVQTFAVIGEPQQASLFN